MACGTPQKPDSTSSRESSGESKSSEESGNDERDLHRRAEDDRSIFRFFLRIIRWFLRFITGGDTSTAKRNVLRAIAEAPNLEFLMKQLENAI